MKPMTCAATAVFWIITSIVDAGFLNATMRADNHRLFEDAREARENLSMDFYLDYFLLSW